MGQSDKVSACQKVNLYLGYAEASSAQERAPRIESTPPYSNRIVIFMSTTYENIYNKDGQKTEFSSVKVQMKFVKVIPHLIYVWSVLENRLQIHTNNDKCNCRRADVL